MNRKLVVGGTAPVVALSVGALALVGPSAQATPNAAVHSAAASSTESFYLGSVDDKHLVFIAHGAIVGSGKDDDSNDNYDVLKFGDGTLRLTHPDSQSSFTPHINPKTCFTTFTGKGKYTLGHGTGKYAGVTGHGTYRISGQAIARRDSSGACTENASPKHEVYIIKGSGPITN